MSAKTPTRYRAEPASAEIVSENAVETGEYQQDDIGAMAKQLLAERVRITERLR